MAFEVPYSRNTYRVTDIVIPGNSTSNNPVEFDLAPAWGGDWARIKSIIYATLGLTNDGAWTPELQQSVIAAFDSGAAAFISTIERIRGLSIPADMAARAGIIGPDKFDPKANPQPQVPITTGMDFSKICGALTTMAMVVASEIAQLSQKAEALDPRLFVQPSGSGGRATSGRTPSSAKRAPATSRRRGTAAGPAPVVNRPAGT